MSTHSPAPWRVEQIESHGEAIILDSTDMHVASAFQGYRSDEQTDEESYAEFDANMKLIAAAPLLLETLNALFDLLKSLPLSKKNRLSLALLQERFEYLNRAEIPDSCEEAMTEIPNSCEERDENTRT